MVIDRSESVRSGQTDVVAYGNPMGLLPSVQAVGGSVLARR
jgi:hypothetical protein